MSNKIFEFIESNLPSEMFKKLPIVPITIKFNKENQEIIYALIDSGSNNSFIDVDTAKMINGVIIDSLRTTGITSSIEKVPVIKIEISIESMDGQWINIKAGVLDIKHPNFNLLLGRDFMENFKQITFDFETKKMILNY
jgi:hypothetical protein